MSDLTSSNCGCFGGSNGNCGCNLVWIILLLSCFGSNASCGGGFNLFGKSGGCDGKDSCEWLIWILLISCFCGNNNRSCC